MFGPYSCLPHSTSWHCSFLTIGYSSVIFTGIQYCLLVSFYSISYIPKMLFCWFYFKCRIRSKAGSNFCKNMHLSTDSVSPLIVVSWCWKHVFGRLEWHLVLCYMFRDTLLHNLIWVVILVTAAILLQTLPSL